jgi:hypothetical protein
MPGCLYSEMPGELKKVVKLCGWRAEELGDWVVRLMVAWRKSPGGIYLQTVEHFHILHHVTNKKLNGPPRGRLTTLCHPTKTHTLIHI